MNNARNIGHEALDSQLNYPVMAWEKTRGQKVSEAELDRRIMELQSPLGCSGNCNQGRNCTCARSEVAGGDEWESADAEVVAWFKSVAWWFFKACMAVCIAWSAAMLANGLLGWIARGGV